VGIEVVAEQERRVGIGGREQPRPAVAEQALSLAMELSVLVARRPSGETTVFPIAINHHERQILAWSVTPGALDDAVARRAASSFSNVDRNGSKRDSPRIRLSGLYRRKATTSSAGACRIPADATPNVKMYST